MFQLGLGLLLNLFVLAGAHAEEIATVGGHPDSKLECVDKILKQRIDATGGTHEQIVSTWVYSELAHQGVKSAVSIEVVDEMGSCGWDEWIRALEIGVEKAPVVYTNIGPVNQEACSIMAKYPKTVFVVTAGNAALELDGTKQPACLSKNILFITALDQTLGVLEYFANWGSFIRLAAPSHLVEVTGPNGKRIKVTNTSVGASAAAGKLATFANRYPELKGGLLIEKFLKDCTVRLKGLEGKIDGSLALSNCN